MKPNILQQNIPNGWKFQKVEELFEIGRGRVIGKGEIQQNPGPYPVYSSQTSNNGEFGRIGTYDFDGEYLTWTTDGIYAGAVFYRTGKFNCTNVCGTLKKKSNLDSKFFSYALPLEAERHVVKTANPKLMNNIMAKVVVPVPPLKEQQKIAEILGAVDENIAKTQELIDTTEKLKRGLMQELFTPKNSWLNRNLSEVANIIMGQSPSSKNYNEIDNGLPLIQGNADIKDRKSIKRFSTSEITREVKKGDIIMGVRAPVGCIATASFDSCIGRGVCGIQPQKIDKNYLYYYLVSKETEFEKKAQGSTFTAINSSEVRKINIVFPNNKEEQKEIADILSSIDEKISVNKGLKEKLITLKKGLMQDLLSGRVRVNI